MLKEKRKKAREKTRKFWGDFQKFATRGNVLELAVGIIIGSAFTSVVTALVNILLSLCTWGVPGGLQGLVTVLPAITDAQAGISPTSGLGQSFAASELADKARIFAALQGSSVTDTSSLLAAESALSAKYTLHGSYYYFNGSALIDWGTFINACISFLIVAFALFIIIRIVSRVQKQKSDLDGKLKEEYYKLHPSERPVPEVPGKPAETEIEVLKDIRDELKKENALKEGSQKS